MRIEKLQKHEMRALFFILDTFLETHEEDKEIYPSEFSISKKILKLLIKKLKEKELM